MQDYNPTVLELTSAPAGTATAELLRLLRRNYHFAWARNEERRPDTGRLVGSVTIGDNRITLEAYTRRDPEDRSREHVIIELDSMAYESAYDLVRQRAHPRGQQALVDFCIEVAATLKVEGFRLRFVADEPEPLSVDKLVGAMTSTDHCGLVAGLAASSASSDKIRGYWFREAKEILGYLVIVLI